VTRGTFICDNCERITDEVHLLTTRITLKGVRDLDKEFTFGVCRSCDKPSVHQCVLDRAEEKAKEWVESTPPKT